MALKDYISAANQSKIEQEQNQASYTQNFRNFLQKEIEKDIGNFVNEVYDTICKQLAARIVETRSQSIVFDYSLPLHIRMFSDMEPELFTTWNQRFSKQKNYSWSSNIASEYGIIEREYADEYVPVIPLLLDDTGYYRKSRYWNSFFDTLSRKLSADRIRIEAACLQQPFGKNQSFFARDKHIPLERGHVRMKDGLIFEVHKYFDTPVLIVYYN